MRCVRTSLLASFWYMLSVVGAQGRIDAGGAAATVTAEATAIQAVQEPIFTLSLQDI